MNDKQLAEFLKYCNPKELYIVTWNNLLKILFCPFKVVVNYNIGTLKSNEVVWVEEVKITNDLKTVYIIKGMPYYYYHFDILEQE
ncbi:hypothetical protein [Winogradskyella sp. SYSU M77433]|uniref:hypothetical protein n=1 Tax=Winogradskyella sp. SYSU M77433 TaxID=3042722 RepID=UPI002481631E|nr:hypothetical protein [Winogradskyella sp. SYSU M77433]MDH7912082.1 hypothetical protein [Winogradskyella sp. SYSU M77433]